MNQNEEKINITSLTGYVDHFIYKVDTSTYTVFVLQTEGKDVTCVGHCRDLAEGETVEVTGEYVTNPMYGKQFSVKTYKVTPPTDKDSIERYLGSGAIKGIGASLAARIVKNFGEDTLRIMEEEPERLAEIKGISLKKAMDIGVQVLEKKDLRNAMIFLADFQISQNLAVKIFETYGAEIYDVMKENPYRLAEDITGVGFGTADKIAAVAGIAKDSPFRIRSGIVYALQQTVADGHTYLPADLLVERAAGLLETGTETVEQQMEGLVFDRKLIRRNDRVYLSSYYYAELNCARMLHDRNLVLEKMSPKEEEGLMKWLQDTAKSKNMETDSLQLEAVKGCVRNGLFLLSGGPGTGKTTTINLIIEYFVSRGLDLLLAAPTGRAAKRMSEATGYEASTIHRLLEIGGSMEEDRNHAVFQKNEENPLEADVVIIDEMSMVDLMLFQALLRAITPGTRLIMVGDVDQLPSVGAGQVLRDLLASGAFPQVILQKIFRQAKTSDIVVNAHKINEGEEIRLDTHSKDFLFMERDREQVIKEIMVWMMRDKLPDYCHADRMDIQVLTPMRKGALGCQELNQFLQQQLNPPAFEKREHLHGDIIFREGDKVMQIKNNYKLEWEITGLYGITVDSGLGVFNGDMGRVKQVDETAASLTVEFDDGRCVVYPWSGLDELELAYATTIHKAQGSEYPAVILPLLDCPKLLQYRNLLYTGITRAKSCVVLLGSSRLVRNMIENTGENRRYSSLQECIAELK